MVFIYHPTKKNMTVNQGTATLTHGECHISFHFSEKKLSLISEDIAIRIYRKIYIYRLDS